MAGSGKPSRSSGPWIVVGRASRNLDAQLIAETVDIIRGFGNKEN